ncbi:MAG: cupin domain-containing protein [Verrucomicrobiales bacterium]
MPATSSNRRFVTSAEIDHVDLEWCHVEWLSHPNIVAAKHLLLCRATFPPDQAHNFHYHPVHEEILYILEGEAEQWVGEEKRVLKAGEIAHIPTGVPHCTFNNGPVTLRFLAMLGPTGPDGPMVVDCFNDEPWKSLRPPIFYQSQQARSGDQV